MELCEEIQIQRLFIGVNELFASRPSKFSVQAADKVKSEWHFLGVFNIEPSGKSNLLKEVTFSLLIISVTRSVELQRDNDSSVFQVREIRST